MNVIVKTVHKVVPVSQDFAHIRAALAELGFTGTEKDIDMLAYKERVWELTSTEVDLGHTSTVQLPDLAEKLSVFSSVPVTSNSSFVFFTIEDFWG